MSQAGIIDFIGTHPQVPTVFVANMGSAIPLANTVELLGAAVAANGVPLQTVASGNTIDFNIQYASASASSVAGNAGVASFNSSQFTVDANGFVALAGGGSGETITGNSGGALSPTAGNWNIVGSGSITASGSGSTLTASLTGLTNHAVLVGAGTDTITKVGPSATTGAVLASNGAAADPSFQTIASLGGITTITGNSGGAESPTAGNFNILGTGSITVAGSANTETVQLTGLTNHCLQVGAGTATLTQLANGTTGQFLTANTGADPSWSSQTAFTSIVVQTFTSNGTYTPTAGMKYCTVEAVGGGGGGGGAAATGAAQVSGGGGGAAGSYVRKTFSAATIGSSQSVTIGSGGAGGTGAGDGSDGTATTFGALLSAGLGGKGLHTGPAVVVAIQGGSSALSTSGDINLYGSNGGAAFGQYIATGSYVVSGFGGGSYFGGSVGARAGITATKDAGNTGIGYGSGGSGACNTESQTASNGGAGTNGFLIVTEYI